MRKSKLFRKPKAVQDGILIGDWEEVTAMPLSSITKKDTDTATIEGLIIKGYETKFNITNENGERYDPACLDDFIKDYYEANGFNLPVDVCHGENVDDLVGRVIYLEVNSVGFYFVAYIPKSVARYNQVKSLLKEGIIQGFSKYGYATEYEYRYKDNGEFDYELIKKLNLLSVSLVATPANHVPFEAVGETVSDRLAYRNRITEESKMKSLFKPLKNE